MSGYKKTPNAKPIIKITLSDELLKRIEDYRYNERIPSRSQAISSLIEFALNNLKGINREKKVN